MSCSSDNDDPVTPTQSDSPKLLVGFVYFGTDNTSGGTNSFVEIYNPNEQTVTLTGKYALHYKTMQREIACTAGCRDDEAEQATVLASPLRMQKWLKLNLKGEIPARHSFLVHMGPAGDAPTGRLNLKDKKFDQNFEDAYDYKWNKGIKVVITSNQNELPSSLKNPFTGDGAGKIAGYMDMVGVSGNDAGYVDQDVDGCEGFCEPSNAEGQSRQKGFARIKTTERIAGVDDNGDDIVERVLLSKYRDTDDNLADFEMFDFRNSDVTNSAFIPRNLADGAWPR
ncbi:MAG: hypothetical protein LBC64_09565 [Fibromonadaceae bacterium]|nr:hypothetical protein [Fibromonadaceae bacterium]